MIKVDLLASFQSAKFDDERLSFVFYTLYMVVLFIEIDKAGRTKL